MKRAARVAIAVAVVTCLAVPLLASGCAPSSPTGAVQRFLDSLSNRDWDAYLGSVLPDNVRELSGTDMRTQQDQFKQNTDNFSGITMKVKPGKKDSDSANVVITGGTITRTNPLTGKKEKTKFTEFPEEVRTLPAKKYKGYWYVDVPLAPQQQESGQPQQESGQPQQESGQPQ